MTTIETGFKKLLRRSQDQVRGLHNQMLEHQQKGRVLDESSVRRDLALEIARFHAIQRVATVWDETRRKYGIDDWEENNGQLNAGSKKPEITETVQISPPVPLEHLARKVKSEPFTHHDPAVIDELKSSSDRPLRQRLTDPIRHVLIARNAYSMGEDGRLAIAGPAKVRQSAFDQAEEVFAAEGYTDRLNPPGILYTRKAIEWVAMLARNSEVDLNTIDPNLARLVAELRGHNFLGRLGFRDLANLGHRFNVPENLVKPKRAKKDRAKRVKKEQAPKEPKTIEFSVRERQVAGLLLELNDSGERKYTSLIELARVIFPEKFDGQLTVQEEIRFKNSLSTRLCILRTSAVKKLKAAIASPDLTGSSIKQVLTAARLQEQFKDFTDEQLLGFLDKTKGRYKKEKTPKPIKKIELAPLELLTARSLLALNADGSRVYPNLTRIAEVIYADRLGPPASQMRIGLPPVFPSTVSATRQRVIQKVETALNDPAKMGKSIREFLDQTKQQSEHFRGIPDQQILGFLISTREIPKKEKTTKPDKRKVDLSVYLEAVRRLQTAEDTLLLTPDQGETLRMLKIRTIKAAKMLSKKVNYVESKDGGLLIWLGDRIKPGEIIPRNTSVFTLNGNKVSSEEPGIEPPAPVSSNSLPEKKWEIHSPLEASVPIYRAEKNGTRDQYDISQEDETIAYNLLSYRPDGSPVFRNINSYVLVRFGKEIDLTPPGQRAALIGEKEAQIYNAINRIAERLTLSRSDRRMGRYIPENLKKLIGWLDQQRIDGHQAFPEGLGSYHFREILKKQLALEDLPEIAVAK